MDPIRNPYAPGAGTPPPELAGRHELLERTRIALGRLAAGRSARSFIAVGLRGVGKTVLLNEARLLADTAGARIAVIEAHEQKRLAELLIPHLRRVLLDLDRLGRLSTEVKRALRVLRGFMSTVRLRLGETEISLDIEPEPGAADSGDLEADLPELMVALGQAAAARGTQIALFIDEVQYIGGRDLGALIMALHRCAQLRLPVMLIAAGLPQIVGLTGRSKSYAERMFDFPEIGPLERADAERALCAPAAEQDVRFAAGALDAIFAATQGYPYFLQEWAYHAWNTAEGPEIGSAEVARAGEIAVRRLDASFFRVRFDRLTPREKDYLRAMAALMAGLGSAILRAGDIAEALRIKAPSVAPLRSGLIAKGMIYSPQHGETAFTVPMFDAFLRRVMPEWQTPYLSLD